MFKHGFEKRAGKVTTKVLSVVLAMIVCMSLLTAGATGFAEETDESFSAACGCAVCEIADCVGEDDGFGCTCDTCANIEENDEETGMVTVTFDLNGGVLGEGDETAAVELSVTSGSLLADYVAQIPEPFIPANAESPEQVLVGWFLTSECDGEAFELGTVTVEDAFVLYAGYDAPVTLLSPLRADPVAALVEFDFDGDGVGDDTLAAYVGDTLADYPDDVPAPVNAGFIFCGWMFGDEVWHDDSKIENDMMLAAIWVEDTTLITSQAQLIAAIAAAPSDGTATVLLIGADFDLTASGNTTPVVVGSGKNIVLRSDPGAAAPYTLTRASNVASLIRVAAGGALAIGDLVLDGDGENQKLVYSSSDSYSGALVYVDNGTFVLHARHTLSGRICIPALEHRINGRRHFYRKHGCYRRHGRLCPVAIGDSGGRVLLALLPAQWRNGYPAACTIAPGRRPDRVC